MFRWLLTCLGLAWSVTGLRGESEVVTAWERVSRHQANDALAGLQSARERGTREAAFAEAVVRMDYQPVTEVGLRQVAAQLTELARGQDEIAQASGYLLGRLYQVHFSPQDYVRAAHAYEQLAGQHPPSYWAQLGLVKLALLQLYVLPEPSSPGARIAAAENLLPRVTVPELQRDLHIVLGRAQLFHEQPVAGVLAHLLAADRIGGLTLLKRGELQLQIAELSRRERHWEQARVYFRRFEEENPIDGRLATVRLRLTEIAAAQRAEGPRT